MGRSAPAAVWSGAPSRGGHGCDELANAVITDGVGIVVLWRWSGPAGPLLTGGRRACSTLQKAWNRGFQKWTAASTVPGRHTPRCFEKISPTASLPGC